jgi:hypothetical protein
MFLVTDGKSGYIPNDYALFRAAKYCGVPPWEMAQQSLFWMNHALAYEGIEGEAQQKRQQRNWKAAARGRSRKA